MAYIVQSLVVGLSRCKAQATKAVATEVRFLAASAGQREYNNKIKGKTFLDVSLQFIWSNVWVKKTETNHSCVSLLRFVSFFLTQTLDFEPRGRTTVSHLVVSLSGCKAQATKAKVFWKIVALYFLDFTFKFNRRKIKIKI